MRLNELLVISCWLSRKHKTDWGLSWSDDLFNLKQAAVGLGPKHQSILRLKQAPVSLKTYFSLIGQLVEACRGALRTYMWAVLNDDLCNPRQKAWRASERRSVGGLKMIFFPANQVRGEGVEPTAGGRRQYAGLGSFPQVIEHTCLETHADTWRTNTPECTKRDAVTFSRPLTFWFMFVFALIHQLTVGVSLPEGKNSFGGPITSLLFMCVFVCAV